MSSSPIRSEPPEGLPVVAPCHCQAIRQASRQVTQFYDRHLAASGLRVTQYAVLRGLARCEPVTVQALADAVVMDRTTLSRALRPLERDGYVQVAPGSDARTRQLSLTPAGHALLARTAAAWTEAQAAFEARYGTSETQDLHGMLTRVLARMD